MQYRVPTTLWLQALPFLAALANGTFARRQGPTTATPAATTAATTISPPTPIDIHCGDPPLSVDVGAGGSLAAVFAVPAGGLAKVTFSTCDTTPDTVLTVDGIDASGASKKCGSNNERVAIQVGDRPAGATFAVEMLFKSARKTGTLQLVVACHALSPTAAPTTPPTARPTAAPTTTAPTLPGATFSPTATPVVAPLGCGDSVSIDVVGGDVLRRIVRVPRRGTGAKRIQDSVRKDGYGME